MLKWLKRIGLGIAALVVLALAAGTVFETYARHRARTQFPPGGAMIDIGNRRIHLDCRRQGTPTVVFEAGLDTFGSLSWSAVQDQVASFTRACSYDRAGILWSDPKKSPQHADAVVDDLHATLAAAGEQGPFVLVGHSLGGIYILDYTRKFGDQVAGLVFVDASHPDQNRRLRAAGFGRLTEPAAPAVVQLSRLTWTGWTRLLSNDETMPNFPARAAAATRAYASLSMPAAMSEAVALDRTLGDIGAFRDLGMRPVVVLTAMQLLPEAVLKTQKMTRADALEVRAIWKSLHDDEARWSTRSRHQLVPDSGHYIQFVRPDVVIAAVREVVEEVRAATHSRLGDRSPR
jgi:pimeloyl-ACP methyl ester carboxylesterase